MQHIEAYVHLFCNFSGLATRGSILLSVDSINTEDGGKMGFAQPDTANNVNCSATVPVHSDTNSSFIGFWGYHFSIRFQKGCFNCHFESNYFEGNYLTI